MSDSHGQMIDYHDRAVRLACTRPRGALDGGNHTHSSTRRLKMPQMLASSWHETAEQTARAGVWPGAPFPSFLFISGPEQA
eukprot:COSAG01_NODE_6056_length_3876_cov_9.951019_7_plen_81_part_00